MVQIITNGVIVVRAITVGKWPIPNITADKTIADQIPAFVGFHSSVFF